MLAQVHEAAEQKDSRRESVLLESPQIDRNFLINQRIHAGFTSRSESTPVRQSRSPVALLHRKGPGRAIAWMDRT